MPVYDQFMLRKLTIIILLLEYHSLGLTNLLYNLPLQTTLPRRVLVKVITTVLGDYRYNQNEDNVDLVFRDGTVYRVLQYNDNEDKRPPYV